MAKKTYNTSINNGLLLFLASQLYNSKIGGFVL